MSGVELSEVEVGIEVRKRGVDPVSGQIAPRPAGEGREDKRPPRPPQEAAKCFKMALRAAQDQSKTLKIAPIAESEKAKKPRHNSQTTKRRAGGGDAPWGKSITFQNV